MDQKQLKSYGARFKQNPFLINGKTSKFKESKISMTKKKKTIKYYNNGWIYNGWTDRGLRTYFGKLILRYNNSIFLFWTLEKRCTFNRPISKC